MAGVITHMVVAREISKCLPKGTIRDIGQFYLGNLAPDAIHAREGYIRAYKKHTHFRDGINDSDFVREDNKELFYSRVTDFIREYCGLGDGLLDLYRGYVVHNLTDELFVLSIREDFCRKLKRLGIEQSDPRFFEYIITDMTRNDYLLLTEYKGCQEIHQFLEQTKIHPVKGYLSAQEMDTSRDWLLKKHFHESYEVLNPRYITYEEMLEFIRTAAKDITMRLSEGRIFPKMF